MNLSKIQDFNIKPSEKNRESWGWNEEARMWVASLFIIFTTPCEPGPLFGTKENENSIIFQAVAYASVKLTTLKFSLP